MVSFQQFLEKRLRNPLRKKALEGLPNHKEILDRDLPNVGPSDDDAEKIENYKKYKVDPEVIKTFTASKIKDAQNTLTSNLLRQRVDSSRYSKVLDYRGIQVYQDTQTLIFDLSKDYNKLRLIKHSLNVMWTDLQGLVPIRKPRIIIVDMPKTLKGENIYATGSKDIPPAYYSDRIIYIDTNSIDEPDYYTHEYGHYIVDLIPKQTEAILRREYEAMLDNYFRSIKKKKRTNLEPIDKKDDDSVAEAEMMRDKIAKKLGLPSAYSATNFDEFWAEIITYWKKMPNNKMTYRFKTIAKKVMNRLN